MVSQDGSLLDRMYYTVEPVCDTVLYKVTYQEKLGFEPIKNHTLETSPRHIRMIRGKAVYILKRACVLRTDSTGVEPGTKAKLHGDLPTGL